MPERKLADPYAVLGVPRDASLLQMARAHRRLAKRFHPDLHPSGDGADRMRRINEAWQILSSSARRAEYDQSGSRPPISAHWGATRRHLRSAPPSTTRTWASWRVTAAETRAAPRTLRQPGELPAPPTRRPRPMAPVEHTFRDSGWAAVAVGAAILLLLALTIVAGRLSLG